MSKVNKGLKSPFTSKDLSIFCEQISMLLKAGIMLHDGIEKIAEETANNKIKSVLKALVHELTSNTFDKALINLNCFPSYMTSIVSIGTESGKLEQSMASLSKYYNRQAMVKDTLKTAVLYPSILMIMLFSVLLFLSSNVLPIFQTVLQGLGTDLSIATNIMMITGQFVSKLFIVIIIMFLLIFAYVYYKTQKHGNSYIYNYVYQLKMFELLSLSMLASSLATTISSGIDINRSFELSVAGIPNKTIKYKAEMCSKLINDEQMSLYEAFDKVKLFSGIASNILSTGMDSGYLDNAFEYVANSYEDEFDNKLIKRISLIEPMLIAVLSTLIGLILVSVLFPLLNIMSVIAA